MSANDFSRGYPRNGQWVVLDGKHVGICQGPGTTQHRTEVDPMSGETVVRGLPVPGEVATPLDFGRLVQVDLVDKTGFRTVVQLLVQVSRLDPVTDRAQIPADRLETYSPTWTPTP